MRAAAAARGQGEANIWSHFFTQLMTMIVMTVIVMMVMVMMMMKIKKKRGRKKTAVPSDEVFTLLPFRPTIILLHCHHYYTVTMLSVVATLLSSFPLPETCPSKGQLVNFISHEEKTISSLQRFVYCPR